MSASALRWVRCCAQTYANSSRRHVGILERAQVYRLCVLPPSWLQPNPEEDGWLLVGVCAPQGDVAC